MRSRRYEFSKDVKRQALSRSNGLCEAVGEVYGLEPGERCAFPLGSGVEFDHYPLPATDEDSDTLENCVSCCPTCHKHKTSTYDTPMQAKGKRIRDKHFGIVKPKGRLQSRGFGRAEPQRSATRKIDKWRLV